MRQMKLLFTRTVKDGPSTTYTFPSLIDGLLLRCTRHLLFLQIGVRVGIKLPWSWLSAFGNAEALVEENLIHVLQAATSGFRVEEVRDGDERGVEHGPDDVETGTKVFDCVRCEEDNGKIGEPVGADTEGDTFVASS